MKLELSLKKWEGRVCTFSTAPSLLRYRHSLWCSSLAATPLQSNDSDVYRQDKELLTSHVFL